MQNIFFLITLSIAAGMISFLASLYLIRKKDHLGLIDTPNARSSHDKPTPKGGGIAIALAVLITSVICFTMKVIPFKMSLGVLMGGSLVMAFLGFLSDRFAFSIVGRLIVQVFIAAIIVSFLGSFTSFEVGGHRYALGFIGIIISLSWLVGITNFYNFMDGIDGLAAMQAIIAGSGIVFFGIIVHEASYSALGLIMVGAVLGFFVLNISPAKIFMGDAGSYFLGLFIASFALADKQLFVPIIFMLGVFIFDASMTLMRRILTREPWFQAHRSHYYQRAVKLGYTHMQVTAVLSIASFFLAVMGFLSQVVNSSYQMIIFAFGILLLTAMSGWVMVQESKRRG